MTRICPGCDRPADEPFCVMCGEFVGHEKSHPASSEEGSSKTLKKIWGWHDTDPAGDHIFCIPVQDGIPEDHPLQGQWNDVPKKIAEQFGFIIDDDCAS